MSELLLLGALVVVFAVLWCLWYLPKSSIPLPPGPKGHFLLGNALDMRTAKAFWLKFSEYNDQYGPLITVRMLHQRSFVVSDPHLISELFEKRASNYSDRDASEMVKLVGWDQNIIFLPYGPAHRRYRTLLHKGLSNRAALDYIPIQQHEVRRFMRRLVEEPSGFMDHVRLTAASIAVRIAYGYKIDSSDDWLVQMAEELTAGFADAVTPARWIVDIIPPLRHLPEWFPLATFQRRAQYLRRLDLRYREEPFKYAQKRISAGTVEASFTSKLLLSNDGKPLDDETRSYIRDTAADLYSSGSHTTVSAIESFFLAMTLYPQVQAKAQAEITKYIQHQHGNERMILPADRLNLPYTSALVRELLRWHPVINIVAHRSGDLDDDNVVVGDKTYRIPARSTVIANTWKMMHDPDVYEQPECFKPERYLVSNPPPDPERYAFGFGRRICPGIHIAQQSLWISVSNILANFTITKCKDQNGLDITPEELYSNNLPSHPAPFQCDIVPKEGCGEWLRNTPR